MTVLVISHMYPSSFNKTAGIFVHQQVKSLIKKGCNVKVISPVPYAGFPINIISKKWKKYSEIAKSDIIDGVEVFYPRYIEFPKSMFFEHSGKLMYLGIKKIYEELNEKYKFDIIHSHVAIPDGFAGNLINKKAKIPHVVTIHGQDLQFTIFKNKKCSDNVLRVYDEVDKVITVSNKLKNVSETSNYKNKICVINNGIDIADFEKISNSYSSGIDDFKFNNSDYNILSVSNLINTKGIDLNIKAIFELKKKYSNIKYIIVGDGEEKSKLSNLVKELNLSDDVIFLGKLSHEKALRLMSLCNVFCLPSWSEGFGAVYIEAMAAGKPVIGVHGQGIQDVIIDGENGFLTEPKNVASIVNKIDFVINHSEEVKQIASMGRKCIIEKYTWDKIADKLIEVYDELL